MLVSCFLKYRKAILEAIISSIVAIVFVSARASEFEYTTPGIGLNVACVFSAAGALVKTLSDTRTATGSTVMRA
jgi:hypothetical protein